MCMQCVYTIRTELAVQANALSWTGNRGSTRRHLSAQASLLSRETSLHFGVVPLIGQTSKGSRYLARQAAGRLDTHTGLLWPSLSAQRQPLTRRALLQRGDLVCMPSTRSLTAHLHACMHN